MQWARGRHASAATPLGRGELALLSLLAAIPRLANLRAASLWLDEIIQTKNAEASLGALWAGVEGSDAHPPLDTLLSWVLIQLGTPEPYRRLLPALLGVATVAILARWASERFGREAGWAIGLVAALSPIHVHYSQELRPYALALFFMVSTLWRFDAVRRRDSPRNWVLLGLALLGCAYTLYFSALVAVVIAILVVAALFSADPPRRAAGRRLLWRLAALSAVLLVAYLPWLRVALAMARQPLVRDAENWNRVTFLRRLEHLTIGGLEGDPGTGWVWLSLALLLIGLVSVIRRPIGWALLAGAVGGTAGVQWLLASQEHWTNDRYYLVAWPFVTTLIGLGVARAGSLGGNAPIRRLAALGLLGALAFAQIPRIERYYSRGRPDWRWFTRAVAAVTGPGDTIVVPNRWTRLVLDYYLPRVEPAHAALVNAWEPGASRTDLDARAGCAFLVASGWPDPAAVIRRLAPATRMTSDPGGLGGRLYRLTTYREDRDCVWALPFSLRSRPRRPLLGDPAAPPAPVLDFTRATTEQNLLAGWSRFEANTAGDTFVWATGERAIVALGGLEPRDRLLAAEIWALASPAGSQRIEVELNGRRLGEVAGPPGAGSWALEAPASHWREDENLLTFRFAHTVIPRELDPSSSDDRPLAVAFHRLELGPIDGGP